MEYHRLIEKTDRKVEVLFSRFLCVTFTTTLQGSSPKQLHVVGVEQTLSPTSSVLSVILINLCPYLCSKTLPHPGPSIFPGGGISLSPPSLKPPLHPPPLVHRYKSSLKSHYLWLTLSFGHDSENP